MQVYRRAPTEDLRRKLFFSMVLIVMIILIGTIGYMAIEGWSILDSLYMTVITLTTVGYREVHSLSTTGILFTIGLLMGGVGVVFYMLTTGAKFILEGEFQGIFGRNKLEKRISNLAGHYIVCGYGRMGRIICRELREQDLPYVVIEKNPVSVSEKQDELIYEGDATHDEVLKEVRIENAKALISVLPSDAENLFVVLSARVLNPGLLIVARAGDDSSEQKLLRAGADRVVSPYRIGGLRIAHTVLKPAVVDFIEFATKSGNIELQMEEISIKEGSGFTGRTLDECGIGRDLGIIIVAVKKTSGEMMFNPNFRTTIQTGDTLIALGEKARLKTLEEMALQKR